MRASYKGKKLIQEFESFSNVAYKPVKSEQYYTIGWGHYGPDVKPDMVITREKADEIFAKDLVYFENCVNSKKLELNQEQFDALVSFTYNCGLGCLNTLIRNRNINEIGGALVLYNKDASGQVSPGLVRRRKMEQELYFSNSAGGKYIVTASLLNVRYGPGTQYGIVGRLSKGSIVTVEKILDTGWGMTSSGFLCMKYLQKY
jgi:GH24 family phage-related lysozyme (muramidase)